MAADANPGEAEKLVLPSADFFANVKYHVMGSLQDQTIEFLKDGNASEKKYMSDDVTHVLVGKDAEENELNEASDVFEVPVIRGDEWVLNSVRCKKWLPLAFFEAAPSKVKESHIFKGLSFSVSGLGSKDVNRLWALVCSRGGQFTRELRPETTHLICGSKCGLKYEKATTKPDKLTLVTPDFVTECVKEKQVLNVTNFHPRLLVRPGEPVTTPQARKVKKKRPSSLSAMKISETTVTSSVPVTTTTITTTTSVASNVEQSQVQSQQQNNSEQQQVQQQQQMHQQQQQQRMLQQQQQQQMRPQLNPNENPQMQMQQQQQRFQMGQHQQHAQRPQMMAGGQGQRPQMMSQNPMAGGQMMSQSGPMMSQPGPMSQSGPMMSQPGSMMSQANPMMSQANPMMSQSNPMMSQSNPMMSQSNPMMSQSNQMQMGPRMSQTSIMSQHQQMPQSQPHMMSSGYGPMSQSGPGQMSQAAIMSQHNPMVSQNQPIVSHQVYQNQEQMQYQQQQQQQYPQAQQPQQYSQGWQQQQQQQQQQQYQWQGQQQQQQQQQPQQQRAPNPMMLRQQQLITQHFANLPMEEKAKFSQMSPHEKQEYLAQRNLLVANHMMQQTTIVLTDQQREMLQTMDPQQKGNFIQKLRQEREMQIRQQQMMRQQQQFSQQQQNPQAPQQYAHTPHTSPQAQLNPQQLSPASASAQMRPQWSGETHPALAQVPRTPQQLQHLQRLQMQREQQQQPQAQHSPNQQMVGPRPPVPCNVVQQQPQTAPQPQPQGQNGSQQKTKAALANMLSNRVMTPQQPQPQSPQPRIQMINVQQQQQQQQPQQPPQPQHSPVQQPVVPQMMAARPPHPQQQPHFGVGVPIRPPQFMGQPQQAMHGPPMPMVPGAGPHPIRYGPPGAMAPRPPVMQPQVPPRPPMPRPLFHGHDHSTKLPPDLCLLGCIFFICDYPDDSEQSQYCEKWRKVIRQYGGEVEDAYHPRITHLLCKTQDSAVSLQALREGKRLVTVYWLNDIVVKKVVLPPWKAIHFPLPANFERPCENMILTMTGFEGRDRDWVKEMINIAGAKYTSYFTKHNHAIVCKSCEGDKYKKAKEWKVPTVSIQWLNDVFFGNMNAVQCMNNPKYHNFRLDQDPFKIEYTLVPNLMVAWKTPIRVTPETYQKFKANPPARLKRKAEKHRLEKEEAKRMREAEENQSAIDPTTGQFIQPLNGGGGQGDQQQLNGDIKENGQPENHREDEIKSEAGSSPPIANKTGMRILLSGFVKSEYEELEAMVKDLGAEVTSQAKFATHLVMPKLGRTISFLCAISYVKCVLKIEWIKESNKEKKLLDISDYRHQDPEFEATFGFNLSKTLARPDRHKLFEGRIFYLTPSIIPSWKKLRLVIEAAGGRVDNRRRKSVDQIRELNKPDRDPVYLIITCEHDLHIVTDVLKAKIGIFNSEFVMSAVMKGKMDFDLTRSITTI